MSLGLLPLVMSSQGPGLECGPSRGSVNWSLPRCLFTLTDTHFLPNCVQVRREPARLCVGFPSSPESPHSGHECERPRGSDEQDSGILSLSSGVTWGGGGGRAARGGHTQSQADLSPAHAPHRLLPRPRPASHGALGGEGGYGPTCLVPASASA